jgi:hypothetical protein
MAAIAPISLSPQELSLRLVADVDCAFDGDLGAIREDLARRLATGRRDIVRGEELALALLLQEWGELQPAVSEALHAVAASYAELPARVAEADAELAARGCRSWIAEALCGRLAFDLAYDALGDIGALR